MSSTFKSAWKVARLPLILLFLHVIVLRLPGMGVRSALSNIIVLAAVLLAAEACWRAGKRESDSTRYYWQLICVAFLFWATGQGVWICYENILRIPLPTTGLTDVFYLGWAAPLLLALFVRPALSETLPLERMLECAQIFVVLTITYMVMFSSSQASKADLDLNTLRVYDIQNAVLVSLFAFQAFTEKSSMRGPFRRIAIFLLVYAVCISIWNHGNTFWGFTTGMMYDLLSSVPFLLAAILANSWSPRVGIAEHSSESATKSLLVNFSPILIPLFPLFALLMGTRMGQRQSAVGLCAMCASFLLFAARLTLTHRRQAILLERLAASDQRSRIISSATNDAVWDWDLSTNALWWGDGFFKLFGYERQDVSSDLSSWSDRLHRDDAERVITGIKEFIARGGQLWSDEYRFRRRDGTYAHIYDRGYVLRNSSGAAVRMIGAMADISDRQALADQLRQAQKMEAVGQLAGGVAHDINNIIMVITSYLTLMEDHLPPSETTSKYIREIRKAAERGGSFTSQLLAFSRRQVLMPELLNLNDYVVEQMSLLQPLIGHHIALKFQPCAASSSIKFDRGQLGQVLMNLAINARDAMPQGGTLTLQTQTVELDDAFIQQNAWARRGRYVCLSVIDTGIGMSPETRARIFEPFFTTKEKGKGTGLGLATVYGIVKQSNALIDVKSELGKGTTFTVYIPASECGHKRMERAKEAPELAGKESILLVEDEAGIREAVLRYLTSLGYEVAIATNGAEGLDLAGKRSFDILVSDVVMPKMNGQELLEQFRKLHPHASVLLISGYTGRALGSQSSIPEGAAFMQKPFSLPHLTARIRELLDQRASVRC